MSKMSDGLNKCGEALSGIAICLDEMLESNNINELAQFITRLDISQDTLNKALSTIKLQAIERYQTLVKGEKNGAADSDERAAPDAS